MAEQQGDDQFAVLVGFLDKQARGEVDSLTSVERDRLLGATAALAEHIGSLPEPAKTETELPINLWEILQGLAEEYGLHATSQTIADAMSLLKAEIAGDGKLVKAFMKQHGHTAAQLKVAEALVDAFRDREPITGPSHEA